MLKKHVSYTFEKLDFKKVLELTRDFVKTGLPGVKEINNSIYVKNDDVEEKVSSQEAIEVFNSGKFDRIHFYIEQKWGNGNSLNIIITQRPNRFSIIHNNLNPQSGKSIISKFVKDLKLIDIYDSRLLKIKNKAERSYMEEALVCRDSEALRAAIIMGWTCVMHRIYSKINTKFKKKFIIEIKKLHKNDKKFKLKTIVNLEDYQQFKDKEVLMISKTFFPNKGLAKRLEEFLDLRNDCAHVRDWKPTESTVDAFFDEIFSNIFT